MTQTDLFKRIMPADSGLFFRSRDPNDIRLGAVVETDLSAYDNAEFVIVSCSQDIGVARNSGRTGTRGAPEAIRESFYRLAAPAALKKGALIDLGDTATEASLERIHDNHCEVVSQLIRDGKTVLVLGGGNDISYPDAKALQSVHPEITAVNVDAHLDIRESPRRNSGTPYRQLIEEQIIQKPMLHEIGIQLQANSAVYLQQAADWNLNLIPLEKLTSRPIANSLKAGMTANCPPALFLGFDMDSVKAADAPGVSAPSPTGLSAEQACELVRYFSAEFPAALFEITEVNPEYDIDNRTSKLAAILMVTFLANLRQPDS